MGIIYDKENGIIGIDKNGIQLYGEKCNLPIEKIEEIPDGKIIFLCEGNFIVKSDKLYVSDYKLCNYTRVIKTQKYTNIRVYDLEGNLIAVYPSITAMTFNDDRKRNTLAALVRYNIDTGSIVIYKGKPSILLMHYDYSYFKDTINKTVIYKGVYKPSVAFRYNIVSKDGKRYTGVSSTLVEIAKKTGYTSAYLSIIKNNKYTSDKIEITEIDNR